MFLVEWRDIDYNIGNYFNGTIFTAPLTGLYSFHATSEQTNSNSASISLDINGTTKTRQESRQNNYSYGNVTIQTTLTVYKGDKVGIGFGGKHACSNVSYKTFFEGRLISRIDE